MLLLRWPEISMLLMQRHTLPCSLHLPTLGALGLQCTSLHFLFALHFQKKLLSIHSAPPLLSELNVEVPHVTMMSDVFFSHVPQWSSHLLSVTVAPTLGQAMWPLHLDYPGISSRFSFVQTRCHQSLLCISPERAFQEPSPSLSENTPKALHCS